MEESPSRPDSLLSRRAEAIQRFPALWARLIADWSAPGGEDSLWLTYSANYLLRTGGLRWAIDPLRLTHRLPGAPQVDVCRDLSPLSLVVLTHRHQDHLDLELIHSLRDLPITWVVPAAILPLVLDGAGLPRHQVIVPEMLKPLEFPCLRLTPFDGLHWDQDGDTLRGVPALGFLAEFSGRRWLFPGDTRTYDASRLPDFGPVDGLLAHLWLGRGSARQNPPPLLEPFIDFCLALRPRRILLTHLDEYGRGLEDLWDEDHARLVCDALRLQAPEVQTSWARLGDCVSLI